jgi:predicted Zn-dependent protease
MVVEVVAPEGVGKKDSTFESFKKTVVSVLNRPTEVIMVDSIPNGKLTAKQLEEIEDVKMRHGYPGDGTLFVILADDYEGREENELGRTHKEFGILLSDTALRQESGGNSLLHEKYLLTTLLHEFGHQLGLPHADDPNCIMLPHARQYWSREEWYADSVPENFCNDEKDKIVKIKQSME